MKRSAGITITAVIDFVGCAFTLFSALASILVFALQSIVPPSSPGAAAVGIPPMLRFFQIAVILIFLLAVVWGVATGIGLLRLREWARISQLLFAGLITLIGVCSAMLMLTIQMPLPTNDPHPEVTQHILQITRLFMAIFYGGLAALGIWWLYYFTRRPIRDEFRSRSQQAVAAIGGVPTAVPLATAEPFQGPMHRGRPVSITVIAALLLLGVVNLIAVPFLRLPVLLFGRLISGAGSVAFTLIFAAFQGLAAYGLLKMKTWGRTLAIAIELVGIVNILAASLMPGSQARFDELMQMFYAKWNLPANVPMIHFPVAAMMLPAIPVLLVILYFLFKEKPAFVESERKAALKSR